MHGEGYRYGAQNEQQLPYVFERVIGILRQRRVARQEASPGVAEHPMVVSDDLTNASFDLRSESFNAQLHRGAIIYVIKASGLNVLLLRATTAYRYVGCRGIVSSHHPFDGNIISLVQWWCKRKTPIASRPGSGPPGTTNVNEDKSEMSFRSHAPRALRRLRFHPHMHMRTHPQTITPLRQKSLRYCAGKLTSNLYGGCSIVFVFVRCLRAAEAPTIQIS